MPPAFKIISRYICPSPAIFPIAQIAYSAISGCLEDNKEQNNGMPPLSIIAYV